MKIFKLASWTPIFTGRDGKMNVKVEDYQALIGLPDCGKMQMWSVYNDTNVTRNCRNIFHFSLHFTFF